jgi:hypothetical protein
MATSAAHQAGLPDNLKTEEVLDLIFRSTGGINPFLGLGNLRGMPFPALEAKEPSSNKPSAGSKNLSSRKPGK